MTEIKELLKRRSEGWESEPDEAGKGLYYTERQSRVFKAIVENKEANINEVAEKATVHPSYVRYIINRLPKDKATDEEWLKEKAGFDSVSNSGEGGDEGKASLKESFGISPDGGEEPEGSQVSVVRYLPVTITVTIPQELLMEEEGGESKLLMEPENTESIQISEGTGD